MVHPSGSKNKNKNCFKKTTNKIEINSHHNYLRQEDEKRCEGFRVVDGRFQQPPMPPVKNVKKTLTKCGKGRVNSENMRILQFINFPNVHFNEKTFKPV